MTDTFPPRLIAATFQLFAREVLGYRFTVVPADPLPTHHLPNDQLPHDRLLGDRLLDDQLLDDRPLNDQLLDDRLLDDRLLDDRPLDDRLLDDQLLGDNDTMVSGNSSPALEYPNNKLAQLSSCESMRSVIVALHQDLAS